ncbi:unnamed protein product [Adineta ricciae]|uniref:PWWP domain-containing protein n=1 Tax=Adineta ricciae TaxID=249248 RepID=A0A814V8T5_ADIRI|nr:unnamed protein product [Adineta ricciae]
MTSSTEQSETIPKPSAVETAAAAVENVAVDAEVKPVNGTDQKEEEEAGVAMATDEPTTTETNPGKRKRSVKKVIENTESISNARPKRTLSKREEVPTAVTNGTPKATKSKVEQVNNDADDEERDKNIPVLYDVADVVWVKMGGHPWWPSLIIRDPNDPSGSFTKVSGNARAKRMYFVVFYGSTADFAWVSDAAIIAYNGVEAFTKFAQECVDKAQTKSQKEQLTERFQLKVTIGRREDWESAVREADDAIKQTSEKRLENIEPKIQFYTNKMGTPKGQTGRRPKTSNTKLEEPPVLSVTSTMDPMDRSLLAEKTFEFKSDEEDSPNETPLRKAPSVKIKLSKRTSNDSDSNTTPPSKRTLMRKTPATEDKLNSNSSTTVFGQTANGSSVSYQQRTLATEPGDTTPIKSNSNDLVNGASSGKKRGRLNPSKQSSSDDGPAPEFHSASPTVTTKFTTQRKPIQKPQAFMNSSVSSGQHDIRTGFLSPFEEQEVLDALDQLGSTKTFDEAEQKAKRRFEHILCLNLNRTHVDIPQEWFYTFLFSHPSIIMKNPQWFADKNSSSDNLNDADLLNNVQSSSSLAVLKHQLVVLSKLYRNELQARPSASGKNRRSTGGGKRKSVEKKHNIEEENDVDDEELLS